MKINKAISDSFTAAAADGTITPEEVTAARNLAEADRDVDCMERAAFAEAAVEYRGLLVASDMLTTVKALARTPTLPVLKGATYTSEQADVAAGQEYLELKGVDKRGSAFSIALARSNPSIPGASGLWGGTIQVTKNGEDVAEGIRALTKRELLALGGNKGISAWFAAAPSSERVDAAKLVLEEHDVGYVFGPNLDEDEDLPEAWANRELVAFEPFDWKKRPRGSVLVDLGGEPSDFSYSYSLLFAGKKVYAVRGDMGGTTWGDLTPFLEKP